MPRARILVVDDDPDNRTILRHVLERRGFEVADAPDGPRALELIRAGFFDVVLLDLSMPEMGGFQVCDRIRADADPTVAGTPVIILSAHREDADRLGGFECGADDYLFKPWTPEQLLPRLETALAKSRMMRPGAYAGAPSAAGAPETAQPEPEPAAPADAAADAPGIEELAERARKGVGANLLILGPENVAADAALHFTATGLGLRERCLYATFRMDAPTLRRALAPLIERPPEEHEGEGSLHLVDGARWLRLMSGGRMGGVFDDPDVALWNLIDLVQRGGARIGQSLAGRGGGRRVFDSLGPLIESLGPVGARQFIAKVAATSISFGGVTTLFLLDPTYRAFSNGDLAALEGVLDAVLEVRRAGRGRAVEVIRLRDGA